MIQLPKILLSADASRVLKVCADIDVACDPVICDASELVFAEPLALCALAATLARTQRFRRTVRVTGVRTWLKQHLEGLDILRDSYRGDEEELSISSHGSLHAYPIVNEKDGNDIGNRLARTVASVVAQAHSSAEHRPHMAASIEMPLAYLFTELIDNAFGHGRARGYADANVWISAQYHPSGGLIRLAVADTGCGFLATLRDRRDLKIHGHAGAVRSAFRPFVSCKRDVGLFADAVHQGLGPTLCRDIATRARGNVTAISGNAWLVNPECAGESAHNCPYWQGAIVAIELRLESLNTFNFRDITQRYCSTPDLPIRFL